MGGREIPGISRHPLRDSYEIILEIGIQIVFTLDDNIIGDTFYNYDTIEYSVMLLYQLPGLGLYYRYFLLVIFYDYFTV